MGREDSKRFFCGHCGVHCFGRGYLEEIGGHYIAVNLNCIDGFDPADAPVIYWDFATTTGRRPAPDAVAGVCGPELATLGAASDPDRQRASWLCRARVI